ncbi:MAG: VOC family protein [Methanomassiliicoccus sp.]|nr:VOC family protein [Methanomassiliicoccus sp.]
MPRVIHFEIPAERPERAVEFYKRVFDWKIEKWAGPIDYWLVTTGESGEPGIDGAIHENTHFKTVVNTVAVDSIDECLQKVQQAGGKVLIPKGAVPGLGYVAFAEDTEGNAFGMLQSDPSVR